MIMWLYAYVKAPLQVMYREYSMRGGVEWQIQHEIKLSVVFAGGSTPSIVFFHTALTDLCFGLVDVEWMCRELEIEKS